MKLANTENRFWRYFNISCSCWHWRWRPAEAEAFAEILHEGRCKQILILNLANPGLNLANPDIKFSKSLIKFVKYIIKIIWGWRICWNTQVSARKSNLNFSNPWFKFSKSLDYFFAYIMLNFANISWSILENIRMSWGWNTTWRPVQVNLE